MNIPTYQQKPTKGSMHPKTAYVANETGTHVGIRDPDWPNWRDRTGMGIQKREHMVGMDVRTGGTKGATIKDAGTSKGAPGEANPGGTANAPAVGTGSPNGGKRGGSSAMGTDPEPWDKSPMNRSSRAPATAAV